MAKLTVEANYLEKPLEEHESTIEINKLLQVLKLSKNTDITFSNSPEPQTSVMFSTSVFTSGAVKKVVPLFLSFFQQIANRLNFSRQEKKITILPGKEWVIRAIVPAVRDFYRTQDKDYIYSVYEDSPGIYILCRVIDKVNYYKELVGPNINRLSSCFRRKDELVLQHVENKELEMLRLIAPVRAVDKDTHFMSQVATLSGIISDGPEEENNEELLTVRDLLMQRDWIQKVDGNYEVTQKFRSINCFTVEDYIL